MNELSVGQIVRSEWSDDHLTITKIYEHPEGIPPIVTVRNHRTGEIYSCGSGVLRPAKQIEFSTSVRYLNTRDMADLGISPDDWSRIREWQWELYRATRPIPAIWIGSEGELVEGEHWQVPMMAGRFHVTADPVGRIYKTDKTVDETMADLDARRVRFLTNQDCEVQMRRYIESRYDLDFDEEYRTDPMLMRALARALDLPWREPVE